MENLSGAEVGLFFEIDDQICCTAAGASHTLPKFQQYWTRGSSSMGPRRRLPHPLTIIVPIGHNGAGKKSAILTYSKFQYHTDVGI